MIEKQGEEITSPASGPFRPYEHLVTIKVLGKTVQVPDKNSVLRCFQFLSPETIPYGRFCWNQDCQYCRITVKLPDDDQAREMLSCKFIVMPGMEITEVSPELKLCLKSALRK
jgi:NADH dehydrogenase/NADH:ubiquinone oxidoreductase subunit G